MTATEILAWANLVGLPAVGALLKAYAALRTKVEDQGVKIAQLEVKATVAGALDGKIDKLQTSVNDLSNKLAALTATLHERDPRLS